MMLRAAAELGFTPVSRPRLVPVGSEEIYGAHAVTEEQGTVEGKSLDEWLPPIPRLQPSTDVDPVSAYAWQVLRGKVPACRLWPVVKWDCGLSNALPQWPEIED
jgi:hypothetical protein